jgi:MFS family permease
MTSIITAGGGLTYRPAILDRERIVATTGFNRWLVPPAALAIHLCIGMAYGFSVFWLPLSRAIGVGKPVACRNMTLLNALVTTSCDWRIADLGWIYTLFFVVLGLSAATWGGWLEQVGPRKAGLVAAVCWCGGFLISAFGVSLHQLWMLWLGSGVIGGIGLGLGYISPVSTLVKWFPDRRGMATGLAIMGFGGGAMIGAPLADILMNYFRTPQSVGVWQTFVALAAIYSVFMLGGAFGYRLPPAGWRPEGWTPPAEVQTASGYVRLQDAHKTPQLWLIWAVLCLNVSAGIGVIGMASPMLQEIFGGALIGHPDISFTQLSDEQRRAAATIAAGFTGLLSLFNIGGRIFWASASDYVGRKATYYTFFILGVTLYAASPLLAQAGNKALFVLAFGVILSMYGGGFATVPAYLADIFGTRFVGAIHGRLLTAWSVAEVIGPVVVNYIREVEIEAGVPNGSVYDVTLYVLASMLVAGIVCNHLVGPLAKKWFVKDEDPKRIETDARRLRRYVAIFDRLGATSILAWLAIGLPICWGEWITLSRALVLFH